MRNGILAQALDSSRTSAQGPAHDIGHEYTDEYGRQFKYYQCKQASTKGQPSGFLFTGTKLKLTTVLASATNALFAGVIQPSASVANSYLWIQTRGVGRRAVVTTGTVALGVGLYWSENGKFQPSLVTATARHCVINAITAESGTGLNVGDYHIFRGA